MHSPGPGSSAVVALPLLGPGWPKHADSQEGRRAWDKGYSLGAGGCPLDTHRGGLLHGSGVGPGFCTSVKYFQGPQLPPGECTEHEIGEGCHLISRKMGRRPGL